jgi:hypothetical protein
LVLTVLSDVCACNGCALRSSHRRQELLLAFPAEWRAEPLWVEGAGHNNIESLRK